MSLVNYETAKAADFMSPHATPDTDFFKISSGEYDAMMDRLGRILEINVETAVTLDHLSKTIRENCIDGMVPVKDVISLCGVATVQAGWVRSANQLLNGLLQALDGRCEDDLDSLLAALEDAA